MSINEQTVDTKVAEIMQKITDLRTRAQSKQDEAVAMGAYKTNCLIDIGTGSRIKISTADINTLLAIGDFVFLHEEKAKTRLATIQRLGVNAKNHTLSIEGKSADDWFHDLKICVLKREAQALNAKADNTERAALNLESAINKRNRAADALLKDFDDE